MSSGLEDLARELESEAPEPTADPADSTDGWELDEGFEKYTDRHGRRFDPNLHQFERAPGGKLRPKLSRRGRLQGKPGVKLPGAPRSSSEVEPPQPTRSSAPPPPGTRPAEPDELAAPKPDYRATARAYWAMLFVYLEAEYGKAWKPTKQETDEIVEATAQVLERYELPTPPPELTLVFCACKYAAQRIFGDEETRERVRSWWRKLRGEAPELVREPDAAGAEAA